MALPNAKRILIVDDNSELAQSLAEFLEIDGHRVITANDPVTALDLAQQTSPQICILDLELPIMDGYELARRLHETPSTEKAMLVALTGYGRDHDPRRAQEAGFAYHLVKPVDTGALTRILQTEGA